MSAATMRGFLPCLSSRFASFATVVVLPDPCRPTSITPAGRSPLRASCSEVSTGPMRFSSSSWQILMKWSPGEAWTLRPFLSVAAVATTSPSAFSLTRARKRLATLNSTSASSSATRMSRKASSTFASFSSALPVSLCLAARNPLVTASNMVPAGPFAVGRHNTGQGAALLVSVSSTTLVFMEHTVAELLLRFSYPAILLLLAADMLSAVVTVPIVVTLGYKFGEHLDDIRRVMHKVQWGIAAAVVVGLVIYLTRRRRRRLQERTPRAPAPAASSEIRESRT